MSYSSQVIDHYENPRNVGSFAKDDLNVGTGMVGAPAIASSSLVTEWVKGKTLDEASTIKNTEIAQHLALPPVKIHCSILAEDCVKAAVEDYRKKHDFIN